MKNCDFDRKKKVEKKERKKLCFVGHCHFSRKKIEEEGFIEKHLLKKLCKKHKAAAPYFVHTRVDVKVTKENE